MRTIRTMYVPRVWGCYVIIPIILQGKGSPDGCRVEGAGVRYDGQIYLVP